MDDDKTPPSRNSASDVLTAELCVGIGLAQLTMNFENFSTDRTSQSAGAGNNRRNDATVKTWEVLLVHASCYVNLDINS